MLFIFYQIWSTDYNVVNFAEVIKFCITDYVLYKLSMLMEKIFNTVFTKFTLDVQMVTTIGKVAEFATLTLFT